MEKTTSGALTDSTRRWSISGKSPAARSLRMKTALPWGLRPHPLEHPLLTATATTWGGLFARFALRWPRLLKRVYKINLLQPTCRRPNCPAQCTRNVWCNLLYLINDWWISNLKQDSRFDVNDDLIGNFCCHSSSRVFKLIIFCMLKIDSNKMGTWLVLQGKLFLFGSNLVGNFFPFLIFLHHYF
jgi:hypothetical protein